MAIEYLESRAEGQALARAGYKVQRAAFRLIVSCDERRGACRDAAGRESG